MEKKNPFVKAVQPQNYWEIIKWLILEPSRVKTFSDTVKGRFEKIEVLLQTYGRECLIAITLWLLLLFTFSLSELPLTYSKYFNRTLLEIWQDEGQVILRLSELIKFTFNSFALSLVVGLILSLSMGLGFGLASGLGLGLAISLLVALASGLGVDLGLASKTDVASGIASGFAFSLVLGLAPGLGLGPGVVVGLYGLLTGLAVSSIAGVVAGLAVGVVVSLSLGLTYFLFHLRIPLFPIRYWQGLRASSFLNSPYCKDEGIWLPIYAHDKKLIEWSIAQPSLGEDFTNFLLQHRKLQRPLAYKLWHAVNAGGLRTSLIESTQKIDIPSVTISNKKELKPNDNWAQALESLQAAQRYYEQQTNSNLKYTTFQKYVAALHHFEQQNLAADPTWNHIYFDTIAHLKEQAENKLAQLRHEVAPIAFNPYQVGNALEPGRDNAVFLDREDLRNELEYIIRNSKNMPLFLIRGQRRVGKTSLLKFLPQILGKGFQVVFLDLQGSDYCPDIPGWLEAIRREVNSAAGIEEETSWEAGNNWITAWGALSAHLTEVAKSCETTTLLCFDEYEALQERGFAEEPEKAAKLLAAMRSYSQHQQQVVFLFSGAIYFDEISVPDWAKYFVNSKPMEVTYLSIDKTRQLITQPYEDFPILYEKGLPERIYELTQGHPALTQEICSYLVDTANQGSRHEVYMADLERIIEQKIVVPQNHPLNRFWVEFCHTEARKETVRELIKGEDFTDIPALRSLMRHNFILKKADGYQFCAPLFEMYVRAVDDAFFEV